MWEERIECYSNGNLHWEFSKGNKVHNCTAIDILCRLPLHSFCCVFPFLMKANIVIQKPLRGSQHGNKLAWEEPQMRNSSGMLLSTAPF